jgi:hypothetical protein
MKLKTFMKLIFIGLIICIVLLWHMIAGAEQITLQWDPVDGVDGYHIYQAIRAANPDTGEVEHSFDYAAPVGTVAQDVTSLAVELPGEQGADTKYVFVARSYRGDDTSVDSNTVAYVVCLVPPLAATDLAGAYDVENGVINLSWSQAPDAQAWRTISHWLVYYRIAGGDWVPIGRVDYGADPQLTAEFDAVAPGEAADVEFTVVTYRRSGVYSENSSIVAIAIDRSTSGPVPPVENLRVEIEIPVI